MKMSLSSVFIICGAIVASSLVMAGVYVWWRRRQRRRYHQFKIDDERQQIIDKRNDDRRKEDNHRAFDANTNYFDENQQSLKDANENVVDDALFFAYKRPAGNPFLTKKYALKQDGKQDGDPSLKPIKQKIAKKAPLKGKTTT